MSHLPVPRSVLNAHVAILGKTGAAKSSVARVIRDRISDLEKQQMSSVRSVPPFRPPLLVTGAFKERPVGQRGPAYREPVATNGNGSLPEGERKILIAVAQFDDCPKEDLTTLTGFKRSTRDAYILRLRNKGFVNDNGRTVTPTQEGMDALGEFEPLPTGAALREYWIQRLPEGERRILELLIQHYPNELRREHIDDETGFKRSTRDAYLLRMRPKRIIDIGAGVKASDKLF
jgi:hypothetical protein